jgi:hypothetical protein
MVFRRIRRQAFLNVRSPVTCRRSSNHRGGDLGLAARGCSGLQKLASEIKQALACSTSPFASIGYSTTRVGLRTTGRDTL